MDRYYRHSGDVGWMGLPTALLFGIAAGTVLGAVYGVAIFYCPLVYVNFLLTVVFGLAVGFASGMGAKMGRVRNMTMAMSAGALSGLFALYVSWVVWINAFYRHEVWIFSPGLLLRAIADVAEQGAWSIHGDTPTGVVLYLIWLVEAAFVIGAAAWFPSIMLGKLAYCETCRRWVERPVLSRPLEPAALGPVKSSLENGDLQPFLDRMAASTQRDDEYWHAELLRCPTCSNTNLLSLKGVRRTIEKGGKEKMESTTLIDRLRLNEDEYQQVHARF